MHVLGAHSSLKASKSSDFPFSNSCASGTKYYCSSTGQGATEYLVLLAVVLIIALVGIVLLGFFPGTASDNLLTANQMYWKSASPIAIVESSASLGASTNTTPYLRVKNIAGYPVRITGVIGSDGSKATTFYSGTTVATCNTPAAGSYNISDFFYLAPGEEKYFDLAAITGLVCDRQILFVSNASGCSNCVGGASSFCQSGASPGFVEMKNFGFEYIEYLENTQITKRQFGTKSLVIKCTASCPAAQICGSGASTVCCNYGVACCNNQFSPNFGTCSNFC
ncbi:MAG: hypothetical protein QW568_03980 [Candidatus Anstonellaceae archaeon]